jgi:hypothetical protein
VILAALFNSASQERSEIVMANAWCVIGRIAAVSLALGFACAAQAGEALAIYPANITLTGPAAKHALIAERVREGHNVADVSAEAAWSSSDETIVKIEHGHAVAVGDGRATITAKHGDHTATTSLTVEKSAVPREILFRNHVQSVLSKSGCNMGSCHGAALGKNGFRLSLRGYDADFDYQSITRNARGRRVALEDPARSLLLTKPTGAVPHKGGVRFEVDSPEYTTIAQWLAAGAPPPQAADPALGKLEILPSAAILQPGQKQRFMVLAHFTDGHIEDVTRWAKYSSSADSVITIDQQGNGKVTGPGEGAVSAWYLSQVAISRATVPYQQKIEPAVFATAQRNNLIDELTLKQLERLNLPPAPMADDAEFLRRAFVDTIGTLPTEQEARDFLGDPSPDKRNRLIEALLNRPEFVDYWAYKWSDLLLVNSEKLRPQAMWAYYRWIRKHVEQNTPWDELVRQVLTAEGNTLENGAANYYVLHLDPTETAENASQAFLGMSIACAKCHNHPLEKWTNDQYYAMANLFSRVRVKEADDGNQLVFAVQSGDLIQPRTGKPQPPAPLDAPAIPLASPEDRRAVYAAWLTAPGNPYFARAITNRIWANYLSVGLVEAVDDLRLTNPASNEELLNALAAYLVEQRYDTKALMRLILQSGTYQRASRSQPENIADRRFYSRYYPRRMMAEVLLDAISQVTAVPTLFHRESGDRRNKNLNDLGEAYPMPLRALQLPDSNVLSYFLKSFGRSQRLLTCECERTEEPSMVQVLHLANGDTINEKLAAKESVVSRQLAANSQPEALVESAYLRTLSRFPTAEEQARLVELWNGTPEDERRAVLEDLYWSLLSCKEFLLNH